MISAVEDRHDVSESLHFPLQIYRTRRTQSGRPDSHTRFQCTPCGLVHSWHSWSFLLEPVVQSQYSEVQTEPERETSESKLLSRNPGDGDLASCCMASRTCASGNSQSWQSTSTETTVSSKIHERIYSWSREAYCEKQEQEIELK